jgi:hypothetical protein
MMRKIAYENMSIITIIHRELNIMEGLVVSFDAVIYTMALFQHIFFEKQMCNNVLNKHDIVTL